MTLTLMDYNDVKKDVEIGELEDIAKIIIEVITGDEVAHVIYKNHDIRSFDSSRCRDDDYLDGSYLLYSIVDGINHINDPGWVNRSDSYHYEFDD